MARLSLDVSQLDLPLVHTFTIARSSDDVARTALVRFMHRENLENRVRDDGTIDRQTLDYLRAFVER